VKALHKKLFRDLARMRGQMLSIALVVAAGIAVFVGSLSTYRSLELAQATYYDRFRFGDVFASLERAPESIAERIAEIPGVTGVETRVVMDVSLDMPDMDESATGRLVSLPRGRPPEQNALFLREGRALDPSHSDEILVNEPFAKAHALRPGDAIAAVLNGRKQTLRVVGVALSPEYIFQMQSGTMFPDDKRFGVMWTSREALAASFRMEGAFNDVSLELARGAEPKAVIEALDRLLDPHGGRGAYGRDTQQSAFYLSEELRQLRTMATMIPAVFLAVAAFLLHVVLSRLLATQREQIAALLALGYGRRAIAQHYAEMVLVVVLFGGAIGTGLGVLYGRAMTELYTEYYHLPLLVYSLDRSVVAGALVVSALSAIVGALGSVRRATKLEPAEAMRPPAPPSFEPGPLERMGLSKLLGPAGKMVLRNLERRPGRALVSATAIALATSILVVGTFSADSMDFLIDVQFYGAQRDDVTVTFNRPVPYPRGLGELRAIPGVLAAEPMRFVPVLLGSAPRTKRAAIVGIRHDGDLRRLLDAEGNVVALPPEGLLLTERLADKLGVRVGDELRVELSIGDRRVRDVPITALFDELVGTGVYMDIEALGRLAGEPGTMSAALSAIDPAAQAEVHARLKRAPAVAGVSMHETALRAFKDTSMKYLLVFTAILAGFASVIAVGVVYNGARVALSERSRELASLRVLGFSEGEVATILFSELFVQTTLGIAAGLGLGKLLAMGLSASIDMDTYRIPAIVEPRTYAFAALVVGGASLVSGLVVRREIARLDMVSVLKTRE